MTLQRCYRATCDAPGCPRSRMLRHSATEPCRGELGRLGWMMVWVPTGGGPEILYLCPEHVSWRPAPVLPVDPDHHAATAWMLERKLGSITAAAVILGTTETRTRRLVEDYEITLKRRQNSAAYWTEPWARRLRAAGAIP